MSDNLNQLIESPDLAMQQETPESPPSPAAPRVFDSSANESPSSATSLETDSPVKGPSVILKTEGPRRPNYRQIHARPLPLQTYPLPTYAPTNPLTFLPVIWTLIRDFLSPPTSHSATPYHGTFSSSTRSVHVTEPATIRALWEMGFFGKGNLSRSEPNWLEFEKRRIGMMVFETAEEYSARRRKDRLDFKRERARIEREMIAEQQRNEAGGDNRDVNGIPVAAIAGTKARERLAELSQSSMPETTKSRPVPTLDHVDPDVPINQEHLQLSLEESLFLSYALGVLKVDCPTHHGSYISSTSSWELFELFRSHSSFPPALPSQPTPDDRFLLSYVTYHHFRSLGWVVREGIKFCVDFLLYKQGPVFSHAAFGVIIMPEYSDSYWTEDEAGRREVEKKRAKKNWHWFHRVNRVQTQVIKTLVLCYVDVPGPERQEKAVREKDVGALLKTYKVREFCVKRWSPNRNRM